MEDNRPQEFTTRKVEVWHITCHECGQKEDTFEIAGDSYGILLGRTSVNQLAVLDAWKDKVFFDEVSRLVDILLSKAVEPFLSDCFRKVVGRVCNPSSSSEHYDFTGKIVCPNCKSANVMYHADEPFRFDNISLPNIRHTKWDAMTDNERMTFVKEKLSEVDCF